MKIQEVKLWVGVAVTAFALCGAVLLAQDAQSNPNIATLRVTDGDPNAAALWGRAGDLATDQSGATIKIKAGGEGTTNWVSPTLIMTGSNAFNQPQAGAIINTGSSVLFYLTGSTGLTIASGTVTAFP